MAYILKLHSAGRLSGNDRRRPALSFASFDEAFDNAREILAYIAENTTTGRGLKAPRVVIADETGCSLLVGCLSSLRDRFHRHFYMDCRQCGNAQFFRYKHWRDFVAVMEA